MRNKILLSLMALILVVSFAACPAPAPAPPAPPAPPPPKPPEVIKWKFQSPFSPPTAWDYLWGKNFVDRVNALSGGRLVIELLPPGAVVPAFEILDAVHKGVLDGGVAWSGYWVGKNSAFSLFASATAGPFGMTNWDYVAWLFAGGGIELARELFEKMGYKVVWFPIWGEMPEPLGWFKKPIKSYAELKGLKMRAAGLAAEVFKEAGVSVVILPAGEVLPALEKGVIDASEYSDPHSDMLLGFHDIVKFYHIPGIHQPTGVGEVLINKAAFDKLPADLKMLIELVAHESMMLNWARAWEMNAKALEELKTKHGVTVVETSREILLEFIKAWDKVAAREAAKNPDFAKIYESQRKFASWFVPYQRIITPPYDLAADYYWPKK